MTKTIKKAFTLVEILISISLFSIIILFLYQTLDMTKKSNSFYSNKLEIKQKQNELKKILFLDMIQKYADNNSTKILVDNEKNAIFQIKSTNIYHNPYYENITYMVSKEKNLLRIESKNIFNKEKLNDEFFNSLYIDVLENNISKFKVSKQTNKKIVFYLEKENKDKIIFSY